MVINGFVGMMHILRAQTCLPWAIVDPNIYPVLLSLRRDSNLIIIRLGSLGTCICLLFASFLNSIFVQLEGLICLSVLFDH
ncbi:hypothetical protein ARMGADRAFT_35201 [Armillaria gallica]|uniref:Uncharacterized protein n=1 Tax=Armillaria gallica TaxID=47427 RepID=A0A2H3EBZ3_ARMGA|nr:hypothetical protein ARMGADRAFT_35201 [Armillaria gallica]